MNSYKLLSVFDRPATSVQRLSDNAFIPFDPANTDYQQFKKDVLAGEQLQDADGNVMTQEEADTFINELP
jgi:hypothetical protein